MNVELVDRAESLRKFIGKFSGEPFIGIDTEFEKIRTFYPILGAFQVMAGDTAYILDPKGCSLEPFWKALAAYRGTAGFFAERKAAEENMIRMAKAMGVENASSGMDFIAALDRLIANVGCADLRMSDAGITKEELKLYPAKVHEVLGGDITADPLPLSDADYLAIFEGAYR